MNVKELEEEIQALKDFIKIIKLPIASNEDFILRTYIETESLSKTKSLIGHIKKDNGNKYQVNDIRDLINEGSSEAREEINDLAYRIYKANKKQAARR